MPGFSMLSHSNLLDIQIRSHAIRIIASHILVEIKYMSTVHPNWFTIRKDSSVSLTMQNKYLEQRCERKLVHRIVVSEAHTAWEES
jgi:hypothetical protein